MPIWKKNLFFCFFGWTKWHMLIILCALFVYIFEVRSADELDNEAHKTENLNKSKKLIDNKKAFNDLVFRRICNSVSEIGLNYEVNKSKSDLENTIRRINAESNKFAYDTLIFIQAFEKALDNDEFGKLDYVRLKYQADELKKKAENLYFLTNPDSGQKKDACRVLEKNKELNVVVLTYGASHGVKAGLKWYIYVSKDKVIPLKTVMVRPYVCAAVVEDGDFDKILPGMPAYTKKIKYK